jgi:hypothetical protein
VDEGALGLCFRRYDTEDRPALKEVKGLQEFVKDMLVKDPAKRLGSGTANGWQDVREHKFFKGFDWERLSGAKMPGPIKPRIDKLNAELPSETKEEFAKCGAVPFRDATSSAFVCARDLARASPFLHVCA